MVVFKNYFIIIALIVVSHVSFKVAAMGDSVAVDEIDLFTGRQRVDRSDPATNMETATKKLSVMNKGQFPLFFEVAEMSEKEAQETGSLLGKWYKTALGSANPLYQRSDGPAHSISVDFPLNRCRIRISIPHKRKILHATMSACHVKAASFMEIDGSFIRVYQADFADEGYKPYSELIQNKKQVQELSDGSQDSMVALFDGLPGEQPKAADRLQQIVAWYKLTESQD
jgi:hypothetical protein